MTIPPIILMPPLPAIASSPALFPILPLMVLPGREGLALLDRGEDDESRTARKQLEARIFAALQTKYEAKYGPTVLVSIPNDHFFHAHEVTRLLVGNPEVQAILRPAVFRLDLSKGSPDIGIGARPAALIRQKDGTFILADLKAVTDLFKTSRHLDAAGNTFENRSVRRDFVQALALKVFVARAQGIPISNAGIVHLSAQKVYDESVADPAGLFEFTDLTRYVEEDQARALAYIERAQETHRRALTKAAVLLTPGEKKTPVTRLYQYGMVKSKLAELGIRYIEDIPDDCDFLKPIQKRQVAALKHKVVVVDDPEGLQSTLQGLLERIAAVKEAGGRLSYFDMEGITPTTAVLRGTRNGQGVALQFSCHVRDGDGKLVHEHFIYDGDPQEAQAGEKLDKEIAEAILRAVGPAGPIIVYNVSHERKRIRELAGRLREHGDTHLADQLDEITGDRRLRALVAELEQKEEREYKDYARQLENLIGNDELVWGYIDILRKSAEEKKKAKAERASELADAIEQALGQTRFVDLLALARKHLFHPDQDDGFTLKSVLKAFYPARSHEHLEIRNAKEGVRAWEERLRPGTPAERKAELRLKLLSYCAHDTLAEDLLLEKLFELAGLPWPFLTNV